MKPLLVSPSLLSADFLHLEKEVEMINQSEADWLHLDIMDGMFVPNLSFGFPVIEPLSKICKKPLDCHLMTLEPERYISRLASCGCYMMNVHVEACRHLNRTLQEIHQSGMKAAVALCPATSLSTVEELLDCVDMILLMSVNPGYSGQKFIPSVIEKTRRLSQMIAQSGRDIIIQIDGGVSDANARQLYDAGARCFVGGNYIFHAPDPKAAILKLKASVR